MFTQLGKNQWELQMSNGPIRIYANERVLTSIEQQVYTMADHHWLIPHLQDISYTPDVHVGEGTCIGTTAVWNMADGYVSPSIVGSDIGCGMRVLLTPLHKNEISNPRMRRKLIRAMERLSPTDEQSKGSFSDIRLTNVLTKGLHGLPGKYVPDQYTPKKMTSLSHVEHSKFHYDHDVLDRLPETNFHRAHRQLGTLGGGNHFVEIQAVNIAPEAQDIAKQWGLFDGQIIVMIHTGSRAWGALLARHYQDAVRKWMQINRMGTPNPKLVYAPIDSDVGQWYLHLMHSALNYAVVNRHLIGYAVQEAFSDVFGTRVQMPLLYDLMHNYALVENHAGVDQLIHRKGATRALPAGHPDNPQPYLQTGHPALIPGSMGTSSYILVGQEAGTSNHYSICHGAGRIRSRTATKRVVTVDQFAKSLRVGKEDEIIVNQKALETIIDESPQAYKDVDQIIDSVVGAGLARVVASCDPLAVLKGL